MNLLLETSKCSGDPICKEVCEKAFAALQRAVQATKFGKVFLEYLGPETFQHIDDCIALDNITIRTLESTLRVSMRQSDELSLKEKRIKAVKLQVEHHEHLKQNLETVLRQFEKEQQLLLDALANDQADPSPKRLRIRWEDYGTLLQNIVVGTENAVKEAERY